MNYFPSQIVGGMVVQPCEYAKTHRIGQCQVGVTFMV